MAFTRSPMSISNDVLPVSVSTLEELQADLKKKHPYKVGDRLKSLNDRDDGFYPTWTVLSVDRITCDRSCNWRYQVKSDEGHIAFIRDHEPGLCAEDYPFDLKIWNEGHGDVWEETPDRPLKRKASDSPEEAPGSPDKSPSSDAPDSPEYASSVGYEPSSPA